MPGVEEMQKARLSVLKLLYEEAKGRVDLELLLDDVVVAYKLSTDDAEGAAAYWLQKGFLRRGFGMAAVYGFTPDGVDYVERLLAEESASAKTVANVLPLVQSWIDLGFLGNGGQGEVRKVRHALTYERGALKRVNSKRADANDRFFREIEAIQKVRSAFVVKVLDAVSSGDAFLVTEYVPLGSLHDNRTVFVDDLWRSLRMVRGIALGLHAAHEQGIIHRDVKPKNILLQTLDHPVVVDFGVAHLMLHDEEDDFTTIGQPVGAKYFAPIEMRRTEHKPTAAFDVFSLGCILHWAISGEDPETPYRDQAQPPKLGDLCVDDLLARMCAKEPKDRLQTMSIVVGEIDKLIQNLLTPRSPNSCPCGGAFKALGKPFIQGDASFLIQRSPTSVGYYFNTLAPVLEECSSCRTLRMRSTAPVPPG